MVFTSLKMAVIICLLVSGRAFADMTVEQAVALQGDLYTLFHLEPALWETCSRAEAALVAYVTAFPDSAE